MPPNVTMSASMMCSFGMAPSTLIAIRPTVLIEGKPAATILDCAPMTNIPPFGMCTSMANPTVAAATAAALGVLTPMPCVSVTTPWPPQAPKTVIAGSPALALGSTCNCAWGGVIQITNPGATKTVSN